MLRNCCNHNQGNMEDLLPLLLKCLDSQYFSEESLVNLLHGLNSCVKGNVLDLRAGIYHV